VLIAARLLWPVLQKLGRAITRQTFVIERESVRFYFQSSTSLIIRVVLSLTLWLSNQPIVCCAQSMGRKAYAGTSGAINML
jgi:hypothetical protein